MIIPYALANRLNVFQGVERHASGVALLTFFRPTFSDQIRRSVTRFAPNITTSSTQWTD